jgi:signal transduction histidine kinase/CheY-like chemotaxis protein/Flp pilus assembly protein TadD
LFAQNSNYHDSLYQNLKEANDQKKIDLLLKAADHFQVINPDTAIVLAFDLLALSKQKGDTLHELEAIVLLGRAYQNRSEFYKSTQYFYKALAIVEKWNNYKKLASYHNSIGISYYYLKDFDKAILHIKKAADYKLLTNEIAEYGTIIGNLAGVLHQLGRNEEAIKAIHIAQNKLKGKKNQAILGNLYNTLGSIYQMAYHQLDSAENCYRKALKLGENEPNGPFQLTAHTNIGIVCNEQNKLDDAAYHLNQALKLCIKLKRDIVRLTVYEAMSTNFRKKKNFESALEFKEKVIELKDSIFKSDKEAEIAKLEAQYQNEKGKQIIQAQKLELEKHRNNILWIVILFIILLVVIIGLVVYFRFQNKIRIQVEKAKETFFADVVHEIRTPLTMIQGPIKVLQSKLSQKDELFQLNLADKNIGKLNDLVNQMLLVNKIDSGNYLVNYSYGNFNDFIEPILVTYAELAKQKEQQFTRTLNIDDSYISFDADGIYKIISNLLQNAVKYTPEKGKIGIEITIQNEFIKIAVWDNGIGISESDQQKIFTRFYRTSHSIQSSAKGIGIGLSLVKSLVSALQGSIDLHSAIGEGSVFSVQLPYQKAQLNPIEIENDSKVMVLLVEDDHDIALFNKHLLEKNNYSVRTALNGALALDILKTDVPDIIITDIMMPVMDGIELLKQLRNQASTEHIPVVILSSKSAPLSRNEMFKLGAQAYLTKPFLPEEL